MMRHRRILLRRCFRRRVLARLLPRARMDWSRIGRQAGCRMPRLTGSGVGRPARMIRQRRIGLGRLARVPRGPGKNGRLRGGNSDLRHASIKVRPGAGPRHGLKGLAFGRCGFAPIARGTRIALTATMAVYYLHQYLEVDGLLQRGVRRPRVRRRRHDHHRDGRQTIVP